MYISLITSKICIFGLLIYNQKTERKDNKKMSNIKELI